MPIQGDLFGETLPPKNWNYMKDGHEHHCFECAREHFGCGGRKDMNYLDSCENYLHVELIKHNKED